MIEEGCNSVVGEMDGNQSRGSMRERGPESKQHRHRAGGTNSFLRIAGRPVPALQTCPCAQPPQKPSGTCAESRAPCAQYRCQSTQACNNAFHMEGLVGEKEKHCNLPLGTQKALTCIHNPPETSAIQMSK